jgi:glycosyltransferase involved in cell wall biosynthesis
VIGYARGATAELVRDGRDGFIVRPDDLDAVLERLLELAADRARVAALGESGRARALQEFSVPRFEQRLNAIYDEIFSKTEIASSP